MNVLDILLFIVLIYGIVKGLIRGFVLQFFSLLGIFIAIYAAKMYNGKISLKLGDWIGISATYAKPISYFIIFCTIILLFHLVAKLLDKSIKVSLIDWVNKLLGAALGLFKYALVLSIFLNVFQVIDSNGKFIKQEKKNKSLLYNPVLKLVPKVMPYVYADFLKK